MEDLRALYSIDLQVSRVVWVSCERFGCFVRVCLPVLWKADAEETGLTCPGLRVIVLSLQVLRIALIYCT